MENGILNAEEGNLIFNTAAGAVNIPVCTASSINIYSSVSISGNMLKLVKENNIILNVFDDYGRFIARMENSHAVKRADVFLRQCSIYNDTEKRLYLVKSFAAAELHNIKQILYHYHKVGKSDFSAKIKLVNESLDRVKAAENYNNVLMAEAAGRAAYFSCFDDITAGHGFVFEKRSRRPPQNALNAMISFGNSVLYSFIANDIHKTALDIKIGYLHATGSRGASLNLDIAEIFKPIIVDRTIFTVINKRMLTPDMFENRDGGVFFKPEGKRIFLTALYTRLADGASEEDNSGSCESLIWKEIQSLQRYIEGRSPDYKPYHQRSY